MDVPDHADASGREHGRNCKSCSPSRYTDPEEQVRRSDFAAVITTPALAVEQVALALEGSL